MAWASERRINGDQLRSAFARVMGQRPMGVRRAAGAPTAAESTLPQAAMEGLAASIDVVIDSPGKRVTTWALVAAGVLLSLGTVWASYWALSSRTGEESTQRADDAPESGTATARGGGTESSEPSEGDTSTATLNSTGMDAAASREHSAQKGASGRGAPSSTPQQQQQEQRQQQPVVVHRDARIDPLLAAWSRASAATWAGFDEEASAAQTMALLERSHALLCAGTHLLQTDLDGAASLQEVIPEQPVARETSPALPTAEAPDQALAASLRQAGRAASSRRKALDVFRAAASGRIARDDASALASTALGDEAREVRRVAQELILDRYTASPSMVLAMVESIPLADDAHGAEPRDFVASFLGAEASIPVRAWKEWATRALAERALLAMEAPSIQVDRIADALRATVAARAVALGASPAVAASQRSADGAAAMVAERLIDLAPAKEAQRLRARLADRVRAADGAPQRFAAVQWSMVDATAAGLVSRWPRLRASVEEIVRQTDRSRDNATTVLQQLAVDAAALLSLQDLELQTMLRPGGPA